MPNDRARTEAQAPAARLQSPADVDIVSRDAKLGIESADRLQARAAEGHVAARYVLGFAIGEEDVHRAARRVVETFGDRAEAGWCEVGTADADIVGVGESGCQVFEPLRVGICVAVEVRDDLAGRRLQAGVARVAEPAILGADG